MRVAIPVADRRPCSHFGHCDEFALVDVDEAEKRIVKVSYLTPPPHKPGVLPKWLHEQGVNVVIAGGMGRRAQEFLRMLGIQIVVAAPADALEKLVSAYLAGTLPRGENLCDH